MNKGKNFMVLLILMILLVGLTAQNAIGSGFSLYEWSPRGIALNFATIARADEPSAVSFNPAGITQLSGYETQFGVSLITVMNDMKTRNAYDGVWTTTNPERAFIPVPAAYFTGQLNDRLYLGVGSFTRFGMGVDWGKDFPGRYSSYYVDLLTTSFNPNLALKVSDNLSVAAGFEVMYFNVDVKLATDATRALNPSMVNDPNTNTLDIENHLTADDVTTGHNLALHYKLSDKVKLGLSYRSKIYIDAEGDAEFHLPQSLAGNPLMDGRFQNTGLTSSVTLPSMYLGGLAYQVTDALSVEVSAIWTHWKVWEELKFTFDKEPSPGVKDTISEKKWTDVWRYQIGFEWLLSDTLALQCGYAYDESPVSKDHSDYLVPDTDRHLFTLGTGLKLGAMTIDLGYMYVANTDRKTRSRQQEDGYLETSLENASVHVVSLGGRYHF